MLQRQCLLLLSVLCAFAGPAFGQFVSFHPPEGSSNTVFLEGSRVPVFFLDYSSQWDPWTVETVSVEVSALLSGDVEQVQLTETGPDTRYFTGSIRLSLSGFPGDGLLQTSRDTSTDPDTFDTLTATYPTPDGPVTATATTTGSILAVIDASGREIVYFVPGDTVHFRVQDPMANATPGVDTTQVVVTALVQNQGEHELVQLTETGGDTGVFEGSVPTALGSDPVQHDGVVELAPGDVLEARHDDANGETFALDQATALSDLPTTIELFDVNTGQPVSEVYQFMFAGVRVTDIGEAGQGTLYILIRSDLRGDQERFPLREDPSSPGSFSSNFSVHGMRTDDPPYLGDFVLEVTELAGPPHQFDTVRVTPEVCSVDPCPTDSATAIGSTLRLLDAQGQDAESYSAGSTVRIEVTDFWTNSGHLVTVVSASGDSETLRLPILSYQHGLSRGSLLTVVGPPVPGDGRLQVQELDTIAASHPNRLGLSSSTDSATVGTARIEFLDRFGNPADFQFESGWARVRATYPGANASAGVDTVAATLQIVDVHGNMRDSEPLELTETGPDTGVFTGQMKLSTHYAPQPNDGELESWYTFPSPTIPDRISVVIADVDPVTVPLLRSKIWLVDASGADATQYPAGSRIYVRLESEGVNFDPAAPDMRYVQLVNLSNTDFEYPLLTETGPDTSIFEGSFATDLAPPGWDGIFNVQPGHTIQAVDEGGYGPDITDQAGILAPLQPDAVDDAASVAEDAPAVAIPVLANDLAPEGRTFAISAVTQGAHGTVEIHPDRTVSYTPAADFSGSDSFTYTALDSLGLTDTATVTVTVTPIGDPPVTVDDDAVTPEDTPVTIDALANDSDPDGDPLTITRWLLGRGPGTVVLNADRTFTYTPPADYSSPFPGYGYIQYWISDGTEERSALVRLTVTAVNDPPVVVDDAETLDEDTQPLLRVLDNDTDPDGSFRIVAVTQGAHGTVTFEEQRGEALVYTPQRDFSGTDSFTYTVQDGIGASDTATVQVTVRPLQDRPDAVDDTAVTAEDTAVTIDVRANDTDADGETLSITDVRPGLHGTTAITADGKIVYTPAADFHGVDSFSYYISDGQGGVDFATVYLTITPVDDPPAAADDSAGTAEDTAITIAVLANDTDPDGDSLSVASVTQGARGSVTINADGSVTYTPNANAHGTDSFTYTVSDGNGGSDTTTVSITISAANDAPDAVDDSATTNEDAAVTIAVLANDSDLDGDGLSVASVTQGTRGSATINADGTITYAPSANAHGTDSFTYSLSDGNGGSDTATVAITISAANDAPDAVDDSATTEEDEAVTVSVLANDSDLDGDSLSVASVTQGARGSVTINADGTITYTPNANAHGTDSFTYSLSDGNGGSDTATVAITISAANDAPDAVNDSASTDEDTGVTVAVLANDSDFDGDSLSVASVTQGTRGSATINADGTVTYTPSANAHGTDSFTYSLSDGNGGSDTATVAITISAANDAPDAVNDSASTDEDTGVTVAVLANDSDLDGDSLSVAAVTQGTRGSATINADGTVTYTPSANAHGTDSFTYTVSDGNGGSDTATVSITISAINDAPDAVNDSANTDEDAAVTISVLANDSDLDGDNLSVTSVTQGARGSTTIKADGTITYTPSANAHGTDSFTYTVSDDNGGSDTATVSVSIAAGNDPPDAVNDSASTDEDAAVTISVLANDSDLDGNNLSVTSATQGDRGSATVNGNGTITYTPSLNAHGTDSFTYTISDGKGGTDTATVSVTISPINDPPVASPDTATVVEDSGSNTIDVLPNDSDVDGDSLTIDFITQGSHGMVSNNGTSLTYTPYYNYSGPDSFRYSVSDGRLISVLVQVDVTVTPAQDPPYGINDFVTTPEDTPVTVGVLANDGDPDGDSLTVVGVDSPFAGTATFTQDSVTYVPAPNSVGRVSFFYSLSDGYGNTATAMLIVDMTAVNDAPDAVDDSATTDEDAAKVISVLANDSDVERDALSVTAVTQGAHGTVTAQANGTIIYTPAANFFGADSFTYTVSDGNGGSDTATVAIIISAVNDAPDAVNDAATTDEDAAVMVAVLANDGDLDADSLSVASVTQGARGSAVINANGTITYTPNANTFGIDSFTYMVRDAAGLTDTATVTINVAAINDPPDAADDTAATVEGAAVSIPVLANDTDLEGNALSISVVGTPSNGTATANGGSITYTPTANFNGTATFTYTVGDGNGGSETATVTVTVRDAFSRVAVLGTNSVWLQTGSDVLSGDTIANNAGSGPFLNGAEVSISGTVTTPAGYDVEGDLVSVAGGSTVASDVFYNQISNGGSITGAQVTPVALPVFAALPAFRTATAGSTDVSVGTNGTRTLAAGSYRDLIVGRKATVTFTGGTYHFRSIRIDREARIFFSAASEVRVQQKLSTLGTTTVGPATGSSVTAASIVFHVAGINGTGGGLAETPKAVEIGTDNTFSANLYAPNGTLWLKDRTQARGAFLGRDVQVGPDAQVTLQSAW